MQNAKFKAYHQHGDGVPRVTLQAVSCKVLRATFERLNLPAALVHSFQADGKDKGLIAHHQESIGAGVKDIFVALTVIFLHFF